MRYIAFLRAINVGGHTVKMADLRDIFESLGLAKVETFIASGNVIFETRPGPVTKLQSKIENALNRALGYDVATFIRTDSEIAAIADYKPFPDARQESGGAFVVAFLKTPLGRESERQLMKLRTEIDTFHVHGSEVYWLCRKKQSESTFSNAVFEKTLKIQATFRGMKSIQRLAAKYPPSDFKVG